MSKGNLFLGYARGKVGDVVFSHSDGEQITRARNRSPRNPKSPLQTLQRVCMNSVSKAYSFMKDICDHSFEGKSPGTPCQSEFARLNVEMLRNKLAYPIAYPFDEVMRDSEAVNFNRKGDVLPVTNEWIVSSGSLRPIQISSLGSQATVLMKVSTPYAVLTAASTYQEVCDALGIQRGDQLTFIAATYNTSSSNPYLRSTLTAFTYARIIMEPADGDMSLAFFNESSGSLYVNAPNPSNEGLVKFGAFSESLPRMIMVDAINNIEKTGDSATVELYPIIGTVILSRKVGDRWLRSSQKMSYLRAVGNIPEEDTFGLAYLSYQDAAGSSLYLNQAE